LLGIGVAIGAVILIGLVADLFVASEPVALEPTTTVVATTTEAPTTSSTTTVAPTTTTTIDKSQNEIETYATAMFIIMDRMVTINDDALASFDDQNVTWVQTAAVWEEAARQQQALTNRAGAITPPPGFEQIQSLIINGSNAMYNGYSLGAEGMLTQDVQTIERAADQFDLSTQLFNEATAQLRVLYPGVTS
jgi:hypothetical protein